MREGFYELRYAGAGGEGFGILVFDTNLVVGADAMGGKYDGTYEYNPRTEMLDAKIRVTIPPGVWLVTGLPAQNREHTFEVQTSVPRHAPEGTVIQAQTTHGPVVCTVRFLRGFPD